MPEPLVLAFLGCGRITGKHARILRGQRDRVRCRFASRNGAKAVEFNQRFGGDGSYANYQAAIDDPEVGVVVVATPPDSHLPLALAALRAGRHVIIEKPAFLRAADADVVRDAAIRAGRLVTVAENYRYRPLLRSLRRLLADNVIGDVRLIQIDAVKAQRAPAWLDHTTMPGALWEGGIHWIHFLASLGPELTGITGFQPGPTGAPERTMLAAATFAGGAVGTLAYSWEVPSPLKGIRMSHLYGTRGVIAFESNGLFVRTSGARNRLHFPGFRDISGYGAMWRDFLSAIVMGREPDMTLELARRDLALVEQCYRSAASPALLEG
jgi:predicted dehydrogenase